MGYSLWGHKESDTNEHISPIGYKGAGQARQVVKKTAKRLYRDRLDESWPLPWSTVCWGVGDARIES